MIYMIGKKLLFFVFLSKIIYAGSGIEVKKQIEIFLDNLKNFHGLEKKEGLSKVQINENKQRAKNVINMINMRKISERSLDKTWKKLDVKKQNDFVSTLSRVVALNAFPRSNKFLNGVTYKIEEPKVKNNEASIRQVVTIKGDEENLEDTHMIIDYDFEKAGKIWRIINIAFDETSLVETYSGQFASIINRDGYSQLFTLISSKKKELEKEYGPIIPE